MVILIDFIGQLSAVQNVPFDFMIGVYISVGVSIMIFVMSAVISNEPAPEKH